MAFVAPNGPAADVQTVSLRASVHRAPQSQSANLLGMAGTAVAVSALGVAMNRRKSSSVARQVVGVCLPLTEKFDPLGLGSTDAKMDRYTQVEIKHGRVAMIAVMGYIMPELFRFPGCEAFSHGLGALESIPLEGWVQLVALVGAHEVLVKPREGGMGPSDFGLGTELLDGIDDEELERKQTSERNNGRLAMIAIHGSHGAGWHVRRASFDLHVAQICSSWKMFQMFQDMKHDGSCRVKGVTVPDIILT